MLFTRLKTTNHLKDVSFISCFTRRPDIGLRKETTTQAATSHFLITQSNQSALIIQSAVIRAEKLDELKLNDCIVEQKV